MWRVAVLHHGSAASPMLARLQEGLRRRGIVDGRTCVVDALGADGDLARLPHLVDQLIVRSPDVMAVIGAVAAFAAKRATGGIGIPVVHATVLDPSQVGLEGGNLTAVTTFDPEHAARQVALLKTLVPGLRMLACLTDLQAPVASNGLNPLAASLCEAAARAGVQAHCVPLQGDIAEIPGAFASIRNAGATGIVALEVPAVLAVLDRIAEAAAHHRLPAIVPSGRAARGLAALGPGLIDAAEPLAERIAAILDGVPAAKLATRCVREDRLIIDLGVARRIGLDVPRAVLKQATDLVDGGH